MIKWTEEMKKFTINFYDSFAPVYWQRHADPPVDAIQKFVRLLNGKKVLDLGCGGGRDSLLFWSMGLDPVCLDLSQVMCQAAREKGLSTVLMDQEHLAFKPNSFDGAWLSKSLLHSPPEVVPEILADLRLILKPRGALFLGMKTSLGQFIETEFKATDVGLRYYCYWPPHHLHGLLETLGFAVGEMFFYGKDLFNERNYFEMLAVKA